MRTIETDQEAGCWRAWRQAVRQPGVDGSIANLYGRLDAEVRRRGPTCWISGRCCSFDTYAGGGHRLFVTGLEIAWFLRRVALDGESSSDGGGPVTSEDNPGQVGRHTTSGPCPYQVDGLCSTHAVRPLGCRIFFCQAGTQAWQQALYERFLRELRDLHDLHELPYRYMEWRGGLRQARLIS